MAFVLMHTLFMYSELHNILIYCILCKKQNWNTSVATYARCIYEFLVYRRFYKLFTYIFSPAGFKLQLPLYILWAKQYVKCTLMVWSSLLKCNTRVFNEICYLWYGIMHILVKSHRRDYLLKTFEFIKNNTFS